MKHYTSAESFVKIQNVKCSCTNVKSPYWKLAGDDYSYTITLV